MHLYKPACPEMPPPRPGAAKAAEVVPRARAARGAPRPQGPAAGWPRPRSPGTERKELERFLHRHGLSLQDTTRARTGMKYRCFLSSP
ncbi:voltage-gated potassium channel subunit beta-1-like protein [Pitangus sulphuratus]|nr:voltage-gated potassium channel subunit beta-1-like protein [Pitangus sulphuratus]